MIDSGEGLAIPPLQPGPHDAKCRAPQRSQSVIVLGVPNVSHRRVAVPNVIRAGRSYSFSHGVAGADHEIELSQIPGLDGRREQWQEISIVTIHPRNAVQSGSYNSMRLDERRHLSGLVKKCVDWGVRIKLQNRFQNFFAAAHSV